MPTKKKFVSPKGVAVFPRLNRPDTKFNEHGTYSADIRVPIKEAKPLMDELAKLYKEHIGSAHPKVAPRKDKEAIWYFEQDEEGDFIKDHVVFKFKAKNILTKSGDLWDRKPKAFDAKGKDLSPRPNIGGGTEMKVAFEFDPYTHSKGKGVRLVPTAVQILELVTFGEGDADAEDYGFEEEEGFEASSEFEEEYGDNNDNNEDADSEENEEAFY